MKKIGVDIGGTTIKGVRADGDQIEREFSLPTRGQEGREAIFSQLFALIDVLMTESVRFIGISSAGNIDPARGVCVYATDNLRGWTGADLAGSVGTRYRTPCRAENDAVCALLGELKFYPELTDVTMLTFGTGVGGASMAGGKIVRGKAFDGARWGHLCLVPGGRRCSCGKRGCAESYLSATALLRSGRRKFHALQSCRELFERHAAGEEWTKEIFAAFARRLNLLLDDIRTALSPQKILLGGGVAQSENMFFSMIEKKEDVAFARLGPRAGIFGALGLDLGTEFGKSGVTFK